MDFILQWYSLGAQILLSLAKFFLSQGTSWQGGRQITSSEPWLTGYTSQHLLQIEFLVTWWAYPLTNRSKVPTHIISKSFLPEIMTISPSCFQDHVLLEHISRSVCCDIYTILCYFRSHFPFSLLKTTV